MELEPEVGTTAELPDNPVIGNMTKSPSCGILSRFEDSEIKALDSSFGANDTDLKLTFTSALY